VGYPALSERAQHLLKALIERYIQSGEPVGSRTLSRDSRLDLSPATIRNVMSDLEELGFVKAPHTSAGRIPTVQGYRCFIDCLVSVRPLETREVLDLQRQFKHDAAPHELLERASSMLSGITRMAGLVTLPRPERNSLRHVEFLPLSDNRILVVLVMSDSEIQNRVIHADRVYRRDELQRLANYFNQHYSGMSLAAVKGALLRDLEETRLHADQIMSSACEIAAKALDTDAEADMVVAGQTNLMTYLEMADLDRLRQLFEAFNEKRHLIALFDQVMRAQGVQIFVGEESGYEVLGDCSVVTAPYTVDGQVVGVLGVIGPTRMEYQRVIPIVDVTARLLSAALNQE
jgi:heat-inducible transcriptional repressor